MAGKIKGLTVEIGGDTTKLGKALENVNKKSKDLTEELGQVNRLLKMDPGNVELIAQKQKILEEAVSNTEEKLTKLKEAEKQVQEQFEKGEVSQDQYRELQREIIATEQKLNGYKNAAKEVEEGNDSVAKSADKAGDETEDMGDQLEQTQGIAKGFVAVIGAAVAGLVAAAEASREYRTVMGKLDTAFTDNGFSSQAATNAYKELVGVLGEADQSVETANHLAKLVDNEKDLATWTGDILPGVFATFGDSLPIEGLTEAANETAKVGQVVGPLADALNWAGISEDKFNEALARCSSEQERQQLITKTLADTYGSAASAYKETNAEVIAANQATDNWNASMAEAGAVVEPVITDVKNLGAEVLSGIVPAIEFIVNNLPMVGALLAGITAVILSLNGGLIVTNAVTKLVAASQAVLNAVLTMNPIGLIVMAIAAVVAAFLYLWKNCEAFREFWINLWDSIKNIVSSVVDWFKSLPDKISEAISGAIDKVKEWGQNLLNVAIEAAKWVLNGLYFIYVKIPQKIWDAICSAFEKVKEWGSKLLTLVKEGAKKVLDGLIFIYVKIPQKIWSAISGAISKVVEWGKQMLAKAKTAASNVASAVVNGLKSLPTKVLNIGKNLVTGLWNGISNMGQWVLNKIKGFGSSILDGLKDIFGIHSPATTTTWMGEMLDKGLANGVLDSADLPQKAMQRVTQGVLDAAQDINGVQLGQDLQANFSVAGSDLGSKLDRILSAVERGQIIAIDAGKLVNVTADAYDRRLGQNRVLAARGAI